MPLTEPIFDSRSYQDILDEALARIPTHNPEWTNFNDSDPGVTLLQLFAFMTESIIYRANRIPERNRQKFLRLLNVGLAPASAASGIVTFSNPRGPAEGTVLAADQALYAGDTPYRTESGLNVLPVDARLYYKSGVSVSRRQELESLYRQLYASYDLPGTELDFYETRHFSAPQTGSVLPSLDLANQTVDGSLWLALLKRDVDSVEQAREALAGQTLTLSIMPALAANGRALYPRRVASVNDGPALVFEIPDTSQNAPRYTRLVARGDRDLLAEPGVVELTLPDFPSGDHDVGRQKLGYWDNLEPLESGVGNYPPSLEDTDDQDRLVTWIRIRLPYSLTEQLREEGGAAGRQLRTPISWVGINAAKVSQRAHAQAEQLAVGTGEPDQTARLINAPVLPASVRIRVNGELWQRIDDLDAAQAEVSVEAPRLASKLAEPPRIGTEKVKVFTVDRESGEVRFGDGVRGMRPPRGANIQASYDFGGGSKGNVGIGSITKLASTGNALRVTNPVPTWGGTEGESVAQAEQRIPGVIRHRNRLVTHQDIREIVLAAPGVSVGRLDVLPNVNPRQPLQDSPGAVTLMVIPQWDPANPQAPAPDNLFLRTLCDYLEPRRVLTTELHTVGPLYKDLWVSVSVEIIPGYASAPVTDAVRAGAEHFLSPLTGGFEDRGWPLNKAVEPGEIAASVSRVEGVAKVNELHIGDSSGALPGDFSIEGLQLPRLVGLAVVTGTAPAIAELQSGEPDRGDGQRLIPVPVVPEEC